ncbi:MAG: hypothetical protein IJ100_01330 [Lachnospiraceae bacterium]|nr:hypothetical protein [Lachnospiraceae bacterium]
MTINGVDYKFFWSVGAHLEYDAWLLANQNATFSEATVQQACIMSKAYNEANGIKGDGLKKSDLLKLPARVLDELLAAVNAQIKADTEITVETKQGKKEAAGS